MLSSYCRFLFFAKEAARSKEENENKNRKGNRRLVTRGKEPCPEVFQQSQEDAADCCSPDIANTTDHCSSESKEPNVDAHSGLQVLLHADQCASKSSHGRADGKYQH